MSAAGAPRLRTCAPSAARRCAVTTSRRAEGPATTAERRSASLAAQPHARRKFRAPPSPAPPASHPRLFRAGADTNDEARFYLGVEKAVLFNTHEDGLTEAEAVRRLEKFGRNQLPEKEDNKLMKLAMEFIQPMPLMIWAAIFIEVRRRPGEKRVRVPSLRLCARGGTLGRAQGPRGWRPARCCGPAVCAQGAESDVAPPPWGFRRPLKRASST